MRRIFLVPQALLDGAPVGSCQAIGINDTQSLLTTDASSFRDSPGWDDWLVAQPGVQELFPWDAQKPAPAALVDAIDKSTRSALSAVAKEDPTQHQALRAIHALLRFY
jgi:hypothetical protein